MEEKKMPDEIICGNILDLFFSVSKESGIGIKETFKFFEGIITESQKKTILMYYRTKKHNASPEVQDAAISLFNGLGYKLTTAQRKRIEAQRRIITAKDSKKTPCKCFICKSKPKSKTGEDGKTQIVCPSCGNYSYKEKKPSDAIFDWNRRNMKLEMDSGQHPSKWGSNLATSRPIERVAARVTKSHVGIKPLKLTESK